MNVGTGEKPLGNRSELVRFCRSGLRVRGDRIAVCPLSRMPQYVRYAIGAPPDPSLCQSSWNMEESRGPESQKADIKTVLDNENIVNNLFLLNN